MQVLREFKIHYFLSKIQEINAIYGQQQVENILNTLNYIQDSNKTSKESAEYDSEFFPAYPYARL